MQCVPKHRLFCVCPNCYSSVKVPTRSPTAHTVVARTVLERKILYKVSQLNDSTSPRLRRTNEKGDWAVLLLVEVLPNRLIYRILADYICCWWLPPLKAAYLNLYQRYPTSIHPSLTFVKYACLICQYMAQNMVILPRWLILPSLGAEKPLQY